MALTKVKHETHQWLKPVYDLLDAIVDSINQSSGGVSSWAPVRLLTAAALPANTFNLGAQTKTMNANGALVVDGISVVLGDRIWDKDDAVGSRRGLYVVTAVGNGGAPAVLKRATDANTSAQYIDGRTFAVAEGTFAGRVFIMSTDAPFTLDTSTPTIQFETNVVHTDDPQTIDGNKAFATLALRVWNAGKTFLTQFATNATANRTATLPDKSGTVAFLDDSPTANGYMDLAAIAAPAAPAAHVGRMYILNNAGTDEFTIEWSDGTKTVIVSH